MKRTLAALLILSFASFAVAEEKVPAPVSKRENRVDYLTVPSGADADTFGAAYPGFAEKASADFLQLETKGKTDFTLSLKRPKGFDGFDRFIRRIPATIVVKTEGNRCNGPVEAVYLSIPRADGVRRTLYSYRYLVCAADTLVSPGRMLDKYVEKYGLFDEKDYDRNQYIYYGVQERYELRVTPIKEGEHAAIEIGVADAAVFNEAYKAWRARLRGAEEDSKEKF